MPVHKIVSTDTRVQLWMHSGGPSADFDVVAMLTDQGGNHGAVAGLIKDQMQAAIDVRIRRTDLPDEDEARQSDPDRTDFFWDGADLVSRPVIVEDVVWDGTRYVPTLRRAR